MLAEPQYRMYLLMRLLPTFIAQFPLGENTIFVQVEQVLRVDRQAPCFLAPNVLDI